MKVIWTAEEQAKVKAAFDAARTANPEMKFQALLKKAQEGLPEDRRRKIAGPTVAPWLGYAKAKGGAKPAKARRARPQAEPAPRAVISQDGVLRLMLAVQGLVGTLIEVTVESVFNGAAAKVEGARGKIVELRAAYLKARCEGRDEDCDRIAQEMFAATGRK